MLGDLVEHLDYDVWKEVFKYKTNAYPGYLDKLLDIVSKHIEIEEKNK